MTSAEPTTTPSSVDKLFSSYDAIFDTFKEITGDFADTDRRKLFHDNAQHFYGL